MYRRSYVRLSRFRRITQRLGFRKQELRGAEGKQCTKSLSRRVDKRKSCRLESRLHIHSVLKSNTSIIAARSGTKQIDVFTVVGRKFSVQDWFFEITLKESSRKKFVAISLRT